MGEFPLSLPFLGFLCRMVGENMSEPIVFISRNRIKPGMQVEFEQHYRKSVPLVIEAKPGTLLQLAFENEDKTEVTIIRLFPSAEALDQQIHGADERSRKTYEFIEPIGIEIYGRPNPATLEKMKHVAGPGVGLKLHQGYIGGFIR